MKRLWKIQSLDELFRCINSNQEEFGAAVAEKEKYYSKTIEIPKKNGFRTICVIDKSCKLYLLQKNLKNYFLDNIVISDLAYGYKRNSDYFQYLDSHTNFYGNNNYLRVDIANFFGSIGETIVAETFDYYIDTKSEIERQEIKDALLHLILYNGELVQGTPIAPVVSNIVFRPLDIRIERYCQKQHITYGRYADDLLFSSESAKVLNKHFLCTIKRILKSKGFKINFDKLRRSKSFIGLNGFVIEESIRLSRKKMKPINRILFYLERREYKSDKQWIKAYNEEMSKYITEKDVRIRDGHDLINILSGNRAFIINAIRYSRDKAFVMHSDRVIKRIENQINIIEKEITKK